MRKSKLNLFILYLISKSELLTAEGWYIFLQETCCLEEGLTLLQMRQGEYVKLLSTLGGRNNFNFNASKIDFLDYRP